MLCNSGSSQNYSKEVHTSYSFGRLPQIMRKSMVPQVPATKKCHSNNFGTWWTPLCWKIQFISPKFCTSGQYPRLQEIKLWGAQCLLIWGSAPDYEIKLWGTHCLVIRVSVPDYDMKYGNSHDSKKYAHDLLFRCSWLELGELPFVGKFKLFTSQPLFFEISGYGMVWYDISQFGAVPQILWLSIVVLRYTMSRNSGEWSEFQEYEGKYQKFLWLEKIFSWFIFVCELTRGIVTRRAMLGFREHQ